LTGAKVGGTQSLVTSADPKLVQKAAGLKVSSGSLANLSDGGIVIVAAPTGGGFGGGRPRDPGSPEKVGDQVTVTSLAGDEVTLKVEAVQEFSIDAIFTNNMVTPATFTRLFGERPTTNAFIKVAGRKVGDVQSDIEKITDDYSGIAVFRGNFIGDIVDSVLGYIIGGINGLLAMSVLIAAIGVINTMTLAVIERRREIGLLRAVGMLPSEARSMVRIESVLIAVIGTVVGLASGAFLGFWLTRSLNEGGGFTFEWAKLGVILLVGLLVGVLASLVPSRRVSKMDVLDALEE
jgi:putative ABC transport system permease protein